MTPTGTPSLCSSPVRLMLMIHPLLAALPYLFFRHARLLVLCGASQQADSRASGNLLLRGGQMSWGSLTPLSSTLPPSQGDRAAHKFHVRRL